jgi:hypothetical protein
VAEEVLKLERFITFLELRRLRIYFLTPCQALLLCLALLALVLVAVEAEDVTTRLGQATPEEMVVLVEALVRLGE